MGAPLHRRTEKIGARFADPFANGEGAERIDTFAIPEGVQAAGVSTHRNVCARPRVLSTQHEQWTSRRLAEKNRRGQATAAPCGARFAFQVAGGRNLSPLCVR
jgi:hypothetical protein